jgi:two-component system sensor kinase FixL
MPVKIPLENELTTLKSMLQAQEVNIKKQYNTILNLTSELSHYKKENADLYDYSSSIYFTIDQNSIIHSLNFKAAKLINLDRNVLINQNFLNFLTINSISNFKNKINSLCNTKFRQSLESEILQKGGTKKQVVIEIALCKDDLIRLSLVDISNIRQLEANFFKAEKELHRMTNLFQDSSEAIASTDTELNIKIINQAFIKLFSQIFSIKIQTGMNIYEVLADFPELIIQLKSACQTATLNTKGTLHFENTHANEIYYFYEMIINSIYNNYTQQIELFFRIRNLTESKLEERRQHKLQADIAIACRTSTMGEMASAFAHEINQPLTSIIAYSHGCLYALKNRMNTKLICTKSPEPVDSMTAPKCSSGAITCTNGQDNLSNYQMLYSKLSYPLEQIAIQAKLAGKIIHNMKDFMGSSEFLFEDTDLNMLIRETVSIFNYESLEIQPHIIFEFTEYLPTIRTNKIHIMQIIINLIRNSIEAFQCAPEGELELIIKTRVENDHIAVHVIDNGPGIPIELQNIILTTYFTTKPQGTGIGLGVCRSLIEAHHGALSLQKHTNKGAWFTFTLPIHPIEDGADARN